MRTHDPGRLRGTQLVPPVWLHGLCTLGWAFFCLHQKPVYLWLTDNSFYGGPGGEAVDYGGMVAAPLVALLRALFYFRRRASWGWAVVAALTAAAFTPGYWLGRSVYDALLENALYVVAPTAFVVAWSSVGLVAAGLVGRPRSRGGALQSYAMAVLALAAGGYGLLQLRMPKLPGPSDEAVYLMTPVVMVEIALCYGVMAVGAWRARSRLTARRAT